MDDELKQGLVHFHDLLSRKLFDSSLNPLSSVTDVSKGVPEDVKAEEIANVTQEWRVNIGKVLFTRSMISEKVREMAQAIARDYKGEPVIAVGLLKGAMLFMTDLLRELCLPYKIEFMSLSSYEGTESTGKVLIRKDIEINPYRQHIIIIEDLIDTGTTLAFVRRHLELKGAKSVRIACLLSKSARRSTNVPVEYIGWECPDEFVIGYGMDFNEEYRCLPFIGVLRPECYAGLLE